MVVEDAEDSRSYFVVVNGEGQYSIWPLQSELPGGWTDAGFTGTRRACLDHVGRVWTDMLPRTLRRALDATAAGTST